jgi:hypothetical protein
MCPRVNRAASKLHRNRQEYMNIQHTALGAMQRYCEFTPKMHQWLHMGRTSLHATQP